MDIEKLREYIFNQYKEHQSRVARIEDTIEDFADYPNSYYSNAGYAFACASILAKIQRMENEFKKNEGKE